MSFSQYPDQLDNSTTLPPSTDLVTYVKVEVTNRLRDSVLAVQAELGTTPSGTFSTVRARLESLRILAENAGVAAASAQAAADTAQAAADTAQADANTAQATADVSATTLSISSGDTTPSNLETKLVAGENITLTKINSGANETIEISSQGNGGTGVVITPLVAGTQDTGSTTPTGVGACILNPTNLGYPEITLTLEVILQVSNSSFDGYFELFNVTEGFAVTHDEIRTTALTPTIFTATLTVGSGFFLEAAQDNLLEGRSWLLTEAGVSDRVICKYAIIKSVPIT